MDAQTAELEQFRERWRAEVFDKPLSTDGSSLSSEATHRLPFICKTSQSKLNDTREKEDNVRSEPYSSLKEPVSEELLLDGPYMGSKQPRSALDYYELAVEREDEGSLKDSLDLYRKAFHVSWPYFKEIALTLQMDHRVDRNYRNKISYLPKSYTGENIRPDLSNQSATVRAPEYQNTNKPSYNNKQLIARFWDQKIEPTTASPESSLPCPLAHLPDEILVRFLTELALIDVPSISRIAQVCKKMAYLAATEESIWKRVCLGSEVGFGAMHYEWQQDVLGGPTHTANFALGDSNGDSRSLGQDLITSTLLHKAYQSSWYQMFRLRPRIRFNGCYISTVNYIRPGQASPSQVSWNSPVHMVTYYRYLRFFRDGSIISLQTTAEPINVVYHLNKELQGERHKCTVSSSSSLQIQKALWGRWRLECEHSKLDSDAVHSEGDVLIETEGANAKYLYRMRLSIRSTGRGSNNKLTWKGFWNYNISNGDLGEFTLTKDKAFFWSRVKSYIDGA